MAVTDQPVAAPAERRRSLAEKVDQLFQTVHPSGRGEYTFEEVARGLEDRGGPTVSATYIWQLRRGIRDNPTKKHLEALAGFFGVPPAYFFDEQASERIEAELEFLAALRDPSVRQVALRTRGLSAEAIAPLQQIIDNLRRIEGLPEQPADADGPWPGEPPVAEGQRATARRGRRS